MWAAAKLFALNPDSARVALEVEAPENITVQGNARLLEQLTLNLLNNARDAMAGRGPHQGDAHARRARRR